MKNENPRIIGIGIIGCGAISNAHIKSIAEIPDTKLIAVTDVKEEIAANTAQKNGCDYYTDYKAMISRPDIDIVDICTPSGLRRDIAVYAAEHGKHIISEKPVEITLERIDDILNACKRNNVFLTGIFNKRYREIYRTTKDIVNAKRLGKLVMADVSMKWYRPVEYYTGSAWRGKWDLDGGGALMNQCIHYVDLLQWFMGPVESVFASTGKLVHTTIEVEDTAAAIIKFSSGAIGTINASTAAYPGFSARISVHGEDGGLIIENDSIVECKLKDTSLQQEVLAGKAEIGGNASASTNIVSDYSAHKMQISAFVTAVREGREPDISGYEARKAVEIIRAIYKSAAEGRQITLPAPDKKYYK